MSDYLSHLLERSFTPARQVQPQVPAIFEPSPAANVVAGPAIDEIANESLAEAPNMARLLENRQPQSVVSEQPASVILPQKQLSLQNSVGEMPVPTREVEKSARNLPDNFPTETYAQKSPASRFQPLARNEPMVPSTVVTAEEIPDAEKKSITEKNSKQAYSQKESSASPSVQAKSENISVQATYRDSTTIIRPITAISPVREPAANNHSRLAGRESGRPMPSADHAPAPDINITIGRIEVRATSPPAALKTKGKKEPEMSLATYLERRSAGGRR
jgi:hypothetical protein